jgi:GNAT superfamily N-acetyltransferase
VSAAEPGYRTPTTADANALAALGRESFVQTFGHLYAPADLDAFLVKAFGPRGLPSEVADPRYEFRIAEVDGAMIAYAKLGPLQLPIDAGARRAIELRQLYVLEPWQGRDVSHALMEWALDRARARGAQDLYLGVYAENWRAQSFYARHGFVEVGTYCFMVGDHADDERIMRRTIGPASNSVSRQP